MRPDRPVVVGLTGGSGAGKGVVCDLLRANGVPCLDTDRVAHELYTPGHPCLAELHAAFDPSVFREDGTPDRSRLAEAVFSDRAALERLNAITHRYIGLVCERWIAEAGERGCDAAVLDAPVLFESGFDRMCDCTVGVIADRETRIRRIMQRDGISRARAESRLASQHDDAFFASRCTYIINNPDGGDLRQAVETLLAEIRRNGHGA